YLCWIFLFLLGAVIALIPLLILFLKKAKCETPGPDQPPAWNASDYQSNADYYKTVQLHDFTQDDNLRIDRISSPVYSRSGKTIIFLRQQFHMPDSNSSSTTIHWLDLESLKTAQLTRPVWGTNDQQIYWADDNTVLFLSNRAKSGLTQLFQLTIPTTIPTEFLEPYQITDYPLNIDNLLVNKQGSLVAFSCQVYPKSNMDETVQKQLQWNENGRRVYEFDKLFIRHWDEYMTGVRNHPFLMSIKKGEDGKYKTTSKPIDVMFDLDSDSPT
ncbi:unnamed protein product, partial [Didymodactylos carnosus]